MRSTSCQNSLQAEKPRIAAAVKPTDAATSLPVPQRRTSFAVAGLETMVHVLMSMLSALCAATGGVLLAALLAKSTERRNPCAGIPDRR